MRIATLFIITVARTVTAQSTLVRHIDRIPQRDTFHYFFGNGWMPERFIHRKNKFYFYRANWFDSINLKYGGYTAIRSGDTMFRKYYGTNATFDTLLLRKGKLEVLDHGIPRILINTRSDTFTPYYKYFCHCTDSTPSYMKTGSFGKLGTIKFKKELYYVYQLSCHYCDRRSEDLVFHPVYGIVATGRYYGTSKFNLHWMKLFKKKLK